MGLKRLISGNVGEKLFLLGNEAVVRGAIEAGVSIAATYPGTPSSEIGDIFSIIAKDSNIYFEFSINEKVAMEVTASSSASGLRSFTFMKHVGLNVASDSFISTAYTGTIGGMVILTADDPSMFSSQNEQDNRHYSRLANLPTLEPSNPQEIKDMMVYAFDLSEKLELPVIIRTTTRVSHMRGIVELGDIKCKHSNINSNNINSNNNNNTNTINNINNFSEKDNWKKGFFKKDTDQFVLVPDNSLILHKKLAFKMEKAEKIANNFNLNHIYNCDYNNANHSTVNNENNNLTNNNLINNNLINNNSINNNNKINKNNNDKKINEYNKIDKNNNDKKINEYNYNYNYNFDNKDFNNNKVNNVLINNNTDYNFKNPSKENVKLNFGVISSGSAFNYVYDVINEYNFDINILKLGFTYPFPKDIVLEFLKDLDGVFVVEEVDPIMEKEILAILGENNLNICVFGKLNKIFPLIYEFTPNIVLESFNKIFDALSDVNTYNGKDILKKIVDKFSKKSIMDDELNNKPKHYNDQINTLIEELPNRPPTLCAGCSHRSVYFGVKKAALELGISEKDLIFSSDIGCYTLGVSPPFKTADYLLSMGSSIGDGCGFSKSTNQKVISFIGDSTFFHSGIPPLINGVHNKNQFVITILDNRTTAMTGGQPNPGIPFNGMGDVVPEISVEKIAIATGAGFVKKINPINLKKTIEVYKEALNYDGLSVIIAKHPCTLIKGQKKRKPMVINKELCTHCYECVNLLACPAISTENEDVIVDTALCKGCTTCIQTCEFKAIGVKKEG
jgi:indolepyruvate ferredoxin oxidoreductase alpha subunit